jgi:hypothetical protein
LLSTNIFGPHWIAPAKLFGWAEGFMQWTESTDRTATDYVLFGLGFIGFVMAVAGVVLALVSLAVLGLIVLLGVMGIFNIRWSFSADASLWHAKVSQVLPPLFTSFKALKKATQNAIRWMNDARWRGDLLGKTRNMATALGKGTPAQRAASGESCLGKARERIRFLDDRGLRHSAW